MHFTVEAQQRIRQHVEAHHPTNEPLLALDATAGNGFDTEFLADLVGDTGMVLALDLQESAIESTQKRLINAGLAERVHLKAICHSNLLSIVKNLALSDSHGPKPICAAMFNLGYLPLGDKSIITQKQSTLAALTATIELLHPNGILSVLSYPGHLGGNEEHLSVEDWFSKISPTMHLSRFQDDNNPKSPVLWLAAQTAL